MMVLRLAMLIVCIQNTLHIKSRFSNQSQKIQSLPDYLK